MMSAAEEWNARYSERDALWTGNVNPTLGAAVTAIGMQPGRALDLGCGEGGDALWLARAGWRVTGVDISTVAVDRATARAEQEGLTAGADGAHPGGSARFLARDLEAWEGPAGEGTDGFGVDGFRADGGRADAGGYGLITASFFQSFAGLDRESVLRRAATWLAPGGALVMLSHGSHPSWKESEHKAGHEHAEGEPRSFHEIRPEHERALFADLIATGDYSIERSEVVVREVTGPDGQTGTIDDTLTVLRRLR
ncbi:class I SAM-dependent methyltransferase [Helcobacillus massiliensis]|uniref:SAM-dependent methyltransferase n=1 Tax=Helcobacillus massiliensis TaxID=521392 RepID=A0A839QXR7_9MICO|nr:MULTISPECIES: class I SAM-dependent methyltransferase [Helcobacillus]MBB3023630.1 SAM-dependent methyltransferase [Helcobacillus massiliensis]MCG7427843.1 class I SAM-dependent methyltransferase [Helcobacillus sp. ACRRO]MCT1558508.1 class I SAM-dependent methyltransferase [Helcobacillus massiliensis]MCT2036047.1 class I SAM-dependent methyltransferase [Helcobacillus massiliensis]MCT2332747.1 class I SAM-dependent methyltransferase [Helcobacillus massiliensis]